MEPSAGPNHSRTTRYATVGTGAFFAAALTYVGVVDPHRPGSLFPACPFKLLTGWDCPACGGLRMTHDLLHGDLAAAVIDNVFLLVALPTLLAWVVLRKYQGRRVMTPPAMTFVAVVAVVWTVVRNIPGFPLVPTLLGG